MFWITGAKGLLGSSLEKKLKGALATGREVDIGDKTQISSFLKTNPGITHIINCAAFSNVDLAESSKEEVYRTNALAPEYLAEEANRVGARLIHISTDYVFGGEQKRPLLETDPPDPCNYYGKAKLEGEKRALQKGALVIRTSWVFGANGKNFVSRLLKMLQEKRTISLVDDQWGRFTYAPDLADAILKMLDQKGLYHFANAGIATKYEFGLAMKEEAFLLRYPIYTEAIVAVSKESFPTSSKRPVYSALDTSKIKPLVKVRHWREALRDFLCEKIPAYL